MSLVRIYVVCLQYVCVSVGNWLIYKLDQPLRLCFQSQKKPKLYTCFTLYALIPIFHFSSVLRDATLQIFLTLCCWEMLGNSRKASASPFVCLLISVSFSRSGHKSGTFAFRHLLESLLGIWLETAESNRERGERRNPNKWTSEAAGIMGKDRESERQSKTRRACRIEGG